MKVRLMVFLVTILVATSAYAATVSLTELPVTNPGTRNDGTYNQYHVQGMTDDGAYVVATSDLAGVADGVMVIQVSDLATTVIQNKAQLAGRGIATSTYGLAYGAANGSNGNLGVAYNSAAFGSYNYAGYLLTSSGAASESQVTVQNALSLDATTGDGWLVGGRTHNKGKQGYAWQYTAGSVNLTAAWGRTVNSVNTDLNGASNDGIAVGTAGYPFWADVATNGLGIQIPAFTNTSTGNGQGNGISADHAYATGYMGNLTGSDDSLHAFRWTYSSNTTEELLPAGGDVAGSQQTNAFDAANDGTIAGFTYNAHDGDGNLLAGYRATIWLPGETAGTLLEDILADAGVGLGDFSYLERCITITPDGKTIAGRGVLIADGSYRGFVVTIPEPATVGFLALGGLALLRRRSR